MANQDQWCFAWYEKAAISPGGADRAAIVKANMWTAGETISVSFLDGIPSIQQRVQDAAQAWVGLGMARLNFAFRNDTTDTHIRISFRYAGSWSTIGTSCKQVPKGQPTMNYGWLRESSTDEEVSSVVLHEFGHALGLIHEHQNPGTQIQWNRDAVIADLSGPPNNWNLETIEHNMFEPYSKNETNFTAIDPASIMMYPLPARWTLDEFSAGKNNQLSIADKTFIRNQYR